MNKDLKGYYFPWGEPAWQAKPDRIDEYHRHREALEGMATKGNEWEYIQFILNIRMYEKGTIKEFKEEQSEK